MTNETFRNLLNPDFRLTDRQSDIERVFSVDPFPESFYSNIFLIFNNPHNFTKEFIENLVKSSKKYEAKNGGIKDPNYEPRTVFGTLELQYPRIEQDDLVDLYLLDVNFISGHRVLYSIEFNPISTMPLNSEFLVTLENIDRFVTDKNRRERKLISIDKGKSIHIDPKIFNSFKVSIDEHFLSGELVDTLSSLFFKYMSKLLKSWYDKNEPISLYLNGLIINSTGIKTPKRQIPLPFLAERLFKDQNILEIEPSIDGSIKFTNTSDTRLFLHFDKYK